MVPGMRTLLALPALGFALAAPVRAQVPTHVHDPLADLARTADPTQAAVLEAARSHDPERLLPATLALERRLGTAETAAGDRYVFAAGVLEVLSIHRSFERNAPDAMPKALGELVPDELAARGIEAAEAYGKDHPEHSDADRVRGELISPTIHGMTSGLANGPKAKEAVESALEKDPANRRTALALGVLVAGCASNGPELEFALRVDLPIAELPSAFACQAVLDEPRPDPVPPPPPSRTVPPPAVAGLPDSAAITATGGIIIRRWARRREKGANPSADLDDVDHENVGRQVLGCPRHLRTRLARERRSGRTGSARFDRSGPGLTGAIGLHVVRMLDVRRTLGREVPAGPRARDPLHGLRGPGMDVVDRVGMARYGVVVGHAVRMRDPVLVQRAAAGPAGRAGLLGPAQEHPAQVRRPVLAVGDPPVLRKRSAHGTPLGVHPRLAVGDPLEWIPCDDRADRDVVRVNDRRGEDAKEDGEQAGANDRGRHRISSSQ